MPRNGSGVYSLPAGSTVANGDTSDATDLNTPLADIASDLNTVRPVVAGGTGASSASAARTALGLAIGTDIQAYSADLAAYVAAPLTAAELAQLQNIDTVSIGATQWTYLSNITAAGAALIDDASTSAQRTTLGLGTAATLNVGTSANNVVQLNSSGELPAVSGTNLTNVPAIGVGQTWQDMSGSRVYGTSYQNTTGRPIMFINQAPDSSSFQVSSNGSTWITLGVADSDQDAGNNIGGIIVPDQWYYRVTGSGSPTYWTELR